MFRQATVRLLAAALAPAFGAGYSSIAAPVAAAATLRPIATCHRADGPVTAGSAGAPARHVIARTQLVPASEDGFHWLDAAVGFGVAVVAGAMALVAMSLSRRSRVHPANSGP